MKKDIFVIAEMHYHLGHITLNQKYIELISQMGDVVVLDKGDYFSKMKLPRNVQIINVRHREISNPNYGKYIKYIPFGKTHLLELLVFFLNLFSIARAVRHIKYKKIFFLSVRNDAIALVLPFFKKDKVAVFHHSDIDDQLYRKYYKFFFRFSKNKYDHICLSEFISDYLHRVYKVKLDRVHTIYQPLVDGQTLDTVTISGRNNTIIGLGQTNDNTLMEEIKKFDVDNPIQRKHEIVLRSFDQDYKGVNVSVINKYLSRETFNSYLDNSASCLLLYPKSFNMRYSGILDDALSHGMSVYGTDIPVVRHFAELYPNTCHVINTAKDVFEVADKDNLDADENEINRFIKSRSDESIKSQFRRLL